MAIVKMSKIKLVGMTACKEDILDAIQRLGCLEVSTPNVLDEEKSSPKVFACDNVLENYDKLQKTIDFATENIEKSKSKDYYPKNADEILKNFIVSYGEFSKILEREDEIFAKVEKINDIEEEIINLKSSKIKLNNLCNMLEPYALVKDKLSDFRDTKHVSVYFGTIKSDALEGLLKFAENEEFVSVEVISNVGNCVILATCLKEYREELAQKLNEIGFSKCPFNFMTTAGQKLASVMAEIIEIDEKIENLIKQVCGALKDLREIKILSDHYKFLLEKQTGSESFSYTASTFTLEGYLPKDKVEYVSSELKQISTAIYLEFAEPEKDEVVPTMVKNGKLATQAEFITEMYSVPDYREIDPNKILFFFFMLFMGVIMADIGYGLMMIIGGFILSSRIKVLNGSKKLWNIIMLGGFFTILFGVLFNSFFGFEVLNTAILPNPSTGGMDEIMTILLLCLLLGVIQMLVGYFIKALNCFKSGDVLGGLFDGLVWVVFFIGFVFASFNFLLDYLMTDNFVLNPEVRSFFNTMQKPGLYAVLGSVGLAALTAGRNEKGFGKFTKGFGAVYGLINIMSDVLSYARLFGLMLSGMIIASTFNDIGLGMMDGGIGGYVLGGLVFVIGHLFNILMGVLGAYIHDSRLQYIEFFSKFYTGEGNKFTPFGSKFNYIYLKK